MELIDSTLLIDILRKNKVPDKYLDKTNTSITTQINKFEVLKGVFLSNNYSENMENAIELFNNLQILELNDRGILKASEISANAMRQGKPIGDSDCLIAGIALSHGINTIITKNVKHFERIPGLKIETY